ncbi:MAG: glycosyltransferase family 9 protein [Leptospirales bacterium]
MNAVDASLEKISSGSPRIGIYRTRYAGDILLLVPLLHQIRKSAPNSSLFLIVNEGTEFPLKQLGIPFFPFHRGSALEKMKSASELGRILRKQEFDFWVDLTLSDRSRFFTRRVSARIKVGAGSQDDHRPSDPYDLFFPYDYNHGPEHVTVFTESVLIRAGLELLLGEPDFSVPTDVVEQKEVDRFILEQGMNEKPFLVLHPGARHWFKRWPPDRFGQVGSWWWENTGGPVFIVGTEEEKTLMESVAVSLKPGVPRVILNRSFAFLHSLLSRAALFIGNDSAPLHLAQSAGTPLIALFGSTTPRVWGPIASSGPEILYHPPSCSPCSHTGCTMGEENCLLKIPVDEVIQTIGKMRGDGRIPA